ncbi:DUF5110 domain-containing protein [Gordoniibacillus kamchatkensis]|uniref:DUF5110 domain-containing protein n=1 Tax=Gordoniibacillus kamchatkensis TaxID=1590651 RepID=UPI000B2B7E4E
MTSADIARAEGLRSREQAQSVENTTDAAYGKRTAKQWDDQYMIGDSLLVAPLVAGETSREVLLPSGAWYGLETGVRYEGGAIVHESCGLERMPIFVREGAVIPLMPALAHTPRAGERAPLELVHFGGVEGAGTLYDDDGETFAYESGSCGWWGCSVKRQPHDGWSGELTGPSGQPASYGPVTWRYAQTSL